jgi:hypothetical protein
VRHSSSASYDDSNSPADDTNNSYDDAVDDSTPAASDRITPVRIIGVYSNYAQWYHRLTDRYCANWLFTSL